METIILPGFSPKNKLWAKEIQKNLISFFPTSVCFWPHWEGGKTKKNWIEKEAEKIIGQNKDKKVNILAKSIGTIVTMVILRQKPSLVNKVIFCGLPLADLFKRDKKYYEVLKEFPPEKFLGFQNEKDPHGSYRTVKNFLHSLNPNLKIIPKPQANHEYPYPNDFINFLGKGLRKNFKRKLLNDNINNE